MGLLVVRGEIVGDLSLAAFPRGKRLRVVSALSLSEERVRERFSGWGDSSFDLCMTGLGVFPSPC